jgi:hypothetical protein
MLLGQTLSPDHSCRDAVHRLNAWRVENGERKVSSNTDSYCEARLGLPEAAFAELARRSGEKCQQIAGDRWNWFDRVVKVIDGLTLTMPDTLENQREYPQPKCQKPGCGFPIVRCVMMFCLSTGAALRIAFAPYRGKQTGENSLLQEIIDSVLPGEILLADRYYATYGNIQRAFKEGYDVVMRSHHRRKIDFRKGFKQGSFDQIIAYHKPKKKPVWMSLSDFNACDSFILVRHVAFDVKRPGYRVKRIVLATTLLDASVYSVEELASLYCRRWQVELDIRSLKTHMQMEHLRCKSPAMVRKEIDAHLIAYNLIRDLIVRTSLLFDTSPKLLSHKGAVQALNAFSEKLQPGARNLSDLERALYQSIFEHPIGERIRPDHPREIKRRPKPYKTMTKPRHAPRKRSA